MKPSLARVIRGPLPLLSVFSASCLLLTSCRGPAPQEGVTPDQAHMLAHFERAGEVHDALVKGELDRARSAAEWIALHEEPGPIPGDTPELNSEIRRYAAQLSVADTLPEATLAAAQMGRACGDCHGANEVRPRFLIGTAPPTGSGPQAEMARHVWASERMWEGLLGPEDHAWRSGAEALKSGWLDPQQVVANPQDRPRIRTLVQQVYELGNEAQATDHPQARAELYGDFLNTCNECHILTAARIR